MAILHRFGSADDFDPSKMMARELAYVNTTNANFKAGLYLCYAPGDVRRQTTEEDIVNILNASPEAYSALQNLITDLTEDPNELANILNNIADLQANKINKSDIIQTDTISNPTKVPSSVVTETLGKEIDTINNNLADIKTYTPTAGIGTLNSVSVANYIKIGKIVIISLDINITAPASGDFILKLPVSAASVSVVIASDHLNKVIYPNVIDGRNLYIYKLTPSTAYRFIVGGSYIASS